MFFALLVTLTSLFGSVTSLHAADHTVSIPDRFSYAVFANKSVILTGSSYLDSYGGTPERYVKGKYRHGNVGINAKDACGIKLTGGTVVYGSAFVGVGGAPATSVCTTNGTSITGGVGTLATLKDLTPIVAPTAGSSLGALTISGGTTRTLTSGTYRYSSINLGGSGKLIINGQVTLIVDGNISVSGEATFVVASGSVVVYANGATVDVGGGALVNMSQNPTNLIIYGSSALTKVNLSGGTSLHGLIYAPDAAVKISGSQETFGAIVGNTVNLTGAVSVHYPEQFSADTTPPVITISSPQPGALFNTVAVSVSGHVNEAVSTVTVKGVAATLSGSAFSVASIPLVEGVNSIPVFATDLAGNSATSSVSVTRDTTPPLAPVLVQPYSPTATHRIVISGSAEIGSTVKLFKAGVPAGSTTTNSQGNFTLSDVTLSRGVNTFSATATDLAGNISPAATVSVTLDRIPPAAPQLIPLNSPTNSPTITVSGAAEPMAIVKLFNGSNLIGTVPANSQGKFILTGVALKEGRNRLTAVAMDTAGNEGPASDPLVVLLDTKAPAIAITAPVNGLFLNAATVTVTGNSDDPTARITVTSTPLGRGDGIAATITGLTFSAAAVPLAEGSNTITVTAVDPAGNQTLATVSVTLDTSLPVVTISAPVNGSFINNKNVTVSGTISEQLAALTANGQSVTPAGLAFSTTVTLKEGANSILLEATDRAGNRGTASLTVTLDSTPPVAPLLNPITTPTRTATTVVSGQVEANSTVKLFSNSVLIATLKADAAGLFTVPNVALTEGNNPFTATSTDTAGNASPLSAPLTVVLDTKAPVIMVTAPQAGMVVSAGQVAIRGAVDEPLASLVINGASTPLNNLSFEYLLTLAAGDNSALITATDLAGNVATTTITIQRDSTPPKVVITTPLNGLLTNSPQIQVGGTVDDSEATLTVGGAAVTIANKAFSAGYVLGDGDNNIQVKAVDKAGNEGTAAVTVTLDAQPPMVVLSAPATATAGTDVQITVNATDNRSLTLVDLSADGALLWSAAPNSATASQSVSLRLSPALTTGATVTVRARALDAAGNSGSVSAVIAIDKGADGPGWLQGKVLDDSRGLPLGGAQVSVTDAKGVQQSITTPVDGTWFFELASGAAEVEVIKSGFTTVLRAVTVRPGQRTSALDSRLTKIDGTVHLVDATGNTVKSSPIKIQNSLLTIDVSIPVDVLPKQVDVRLTPVSNQGLITPLPLGWSPLAVVDLRLLDPVTAAPTDLQLTAPVTLSLPLPIGLGDNALMLELARYESSSRSWMAVAEVAIAAKATTATVQIYQPGQYALVLADPTPLNPPVPTAGSDVAAATLQPSSFNLQPFSDVSLITTTGRVVPQAAPPCAGLRAAGDLQLVARTDAVTAPTLISGLVVNTRITEKFDLTSGDTLQPTETLQDIVLYRFPCVTAISGGVTEPPFDSAQGTGLRTTFPVSPSRDFTIVDLLLGKINIEVTPPDSGGGVMVGADGARLLQPDGTALSIPAGALTGTAPVSVATIPEATVTSLVGADFRLLRGVSVTITGQTLKNSATLSIPAPDGFNAILPVVVAKKFDVKGGSKLKLVAAAKLSGSIINSELLTSELLNSTNSINSSGVYCFLQAVAPIGYVAGQITDAAAAAFAAIQISAQSATLSDLTGVSGQYLLALAAGVQTVTALDPVRGDAASGTVAITANTKSTFNLNVRTIPPRISGITPANGAINVQPTVPVVITFSKPMDKNSINSTTLKLTNSTNSEPVPGVLTFNGDTTAVTFYPSDAFTQEATYNVTISATVKDLQGYQLGQDVASVFVVRRTTPPVMPAAGSVSGSFPDADGFITVTATQGSAETGNTVLLINDTSGEIQSVTPATNGSFTGKVRGQLGDEIKVILMDYSGNRTLISYITYKSDDGKYLVTAKGGKVEGEGGVLLDIPEGALVGPAVFKIKQLLATDLPHPVPEGVRILGALNIDSGGSYLRKEVHLSIPLPSDMPVGAVPFLAQPTTMTNADGTVEKVYEVIDSIKVINGRLTTASPPFDGVTGFGDFVFLIVTGQVMGDVIVSGTAYRDMDGLPGYTPGVDKPIQGAVIRSPQSANFVSYSKADGRYATFGFAANGSCRNFPITAVHPQTMFKSTANITTCDAPYFVKNLNFKLADKDTVLPDKTAPIIDLNMAVASGQVGNPRFVSGTINTGTEMTLPLTITDQLMGSASLTIGFTAQGMNSAVRIPVTLMASGQSLVSTNAGMLTRYTYTPDFPSDIAGSSSFRFKPMQEGRYDFTVEATDESKNKSSRSISIRAIPQGSSLGSGKEGAPAIDSTVPSDKSVDVMVTSPVMVWFSEPVENVDDSTFVLFDSETGIKVPTTVQSGLEGGRMLATLIPKGNLYYGRKYEFQLTDSITDSYPNADGNKQNLASFSATFTTKVPKGYDLTDTPFAGRDIDLFTFNDDNGDSSTYAYLTAGTQGWRITNVTDPTVPATIYPTDGKTFPAGFDYRNLAINQDKKIMGMTENITFSDGNQYGYVRFYDLYADPANPPIIGREKLTEAYSGIPGRIAMMGDFAYVATINAGLQVIDIQLAISNQNNGQPSDGTAIAGVFDSVGQGYGQPNDIAAYGVNKTLLTTTSGNLVVLDVSLPLPQLMAQYQDSNHHPLRVGVAPEYSYLNSFGVQEVKDIGLAGTREGKVVTIDLSDPYNPATMAVTKNESGNDLVTLIREMSVNKEAGLAFITTNSSIQVIDIKDPANPRLLSTIASLPDNNGALTPLGQIPALVEKGGWVYLASQNKGLSVVDFDPATAVIEVPAIRLATPIKGFSNDLRVPITYRVFENGDFSPISASMYVYETTDSTRKVIAKYSQIPHYGTNTILFPAKDIGIEFDVRKKYEVEVLFEEGLAQSLINKYKPSRKRIPLEWQAIATDYNRDGIINDGDFGEAMAENPYYFWINDNDDQDDVTGNSIPGSGPDWKKTNISGTRDLVDYFPVHLDIKPLIDVLPLQYYKYVLKHEDSALTYSGTELTNMEARKYLNDVDIALKIAGSGTFSPDHIKYPVTRGGSNIRAEHLQLLQKNGSALLLMQGKFKTRNPLVLEVVDRSNNEVAFRSKMALSLDGVEQMFRHKNLIRYVKGGNGPLPAQNSNAGGEPDRFLAANEQPTNYPDSEVKNDVNLVMLHGYNVDGQEARGFHSEMFKRLYWSGSKAKFWAISWYGAETKKYLANKFTLDYHTNVVNAFDTAPILKDFLNFNVKGDVTIIAHSLGNMVASSMLSDNYQSWDANYSASHLMPKIKNYFMVDAAVAIEAYDGDATKSLDMIHKDWVNYKQSLWPSEWYKLFSNDYPPDNRAKLTWRGRFKDRPANTTYYNFYSSGEEVLGALPFNTPITQILVDEAQQVGSYAWAIQEKLKGGNPIPVDIIGSSMGGWGFNPDDKEYYLTKLDVYGYVLPVPIPASDANLIDENVLKTKPFFKKGPDPDLYWPGITGSTYVANNMNRLLADAIPALTLPVGANFTSVFGQANKNNFDMQEVYKNDKKDWPSLRIEKNWRHSDLKDVSYIYVYNLFDAFVTLGGLK